MILEAEIDAEMEHALFIIMTEVQNEHKDGLHALLALLAERCSSVDSLAGR
jgi:hypothetical protein